MDELVQWLRDQLDEDERAARAAAKEDGPDWCYDGHAVLTRREGDLVAVGSQDFMELERGEHIAEWDPARVLREIGAKRALLRRANGGVDHPHTHPGEDDVNHLRRHHDDGLLRLLALPYADRPGYRDEWRP